MFAAIGSRPPAKGFTLLELMVVVALIALATAAASLALRDSAADALERDAQRLIAQLERARSWARASDTAVMWTPIDGGFRFVGLRMAIPSQESAESWLSADTRTEPDARLVLGPEPVLPPQHIRLLSAASPSRTLTIATDGVAPFSIRTQVP